MEELIRAIAAFHKNREIFQIKLAAQKTQDGRLAVLLNAVELLMEQDAALLEICQTLAARGNSAPVNEPNEESLDAAAPAEPAAVEPAVEAAEEADAADAVNEVVVADAANAADVVNEVAAADEADGSGEAANEVVVADAADAADVADAVDNASKPASKKRGRPKKV